ncbi:hypothetical protein [Catenovulum adriaticum]|uniref:Outer membrane OprD family porin n=1 Tax=Catenovulum adriaticum TaxID=2984846 RepID=A0ABY7AJL5_9ALTE|nr:hypothetical protein [Catenovulum sp. TS8]WAJ69719.1 hypothetical protein OLW01_11210 [Catenovulum sp. TS8]
MSIRRNLAFKMQNKLMKVALMLCSSLASSFVYAQPNDFHFNGFLTVAGYHGSSNQIGYKSSILGEQASHRGEWVFDDLSLLGGQINYSVNDQWQLVGQAVLKNELVDTDFDRIKIATLNYRPSSAWLFRAGRFYPRGYLISETRLIGYAHNQVLPVQDFYAQLPLPYVDGIDATYTQRTDFGLFSANLYFGETNITVDLGGDEPVTSEFKNLVGANLEYESRNWLLRAAYSQVEQIEGWGIIDEIEDFFTLLAHPALLQTKTQFMPWAEGAAFLQSDKAKDGVFKYYTLASEHNKGALRVRAELAHLSSGSFLLPDTDSGYVNFAYTHGEVTPFATLSFINSDKDKPFSTQPSGDLLDQVDQVLGIDSRVTLTVINGFLEPVYKQKSATLGMRWDFAQQQAVKVQFERKWVDKNSAGLWRVNQFSQTQAEQVDVFLVSYDRMF